MICNSNRISHKSDNKKQLAIEAKRWASKKSITSCKKSYRPVIVCINAVLIATSLCVSDARGDAQLTAADSPQVQGVANAIVLDDLPLLSTKELENIIRTLHRQNLNLKAQIAELEAEFSKFKFKHKYRKEGNDLQTPTKNGGESKQPNRSPLSLDSKNDKIKIPNSTRQRYDFRDINNILRRAPKAAIPIRPAHWNEIYQTRFNDWAQDNVIGKKLLVQATMRTHPSVFDSNTGEKKISIDFRLWKKILRRGVEESVDCTFVYKNRRYSVPRITAIFDMKHGDRLSKIKRTIGSTIGTRVKFIGTIASFNMLLKENNGGLVIYITLVDCSSPI